MKKLFLGALALTLAVSVYSCKETVKDAEKVAGDAVEAVGDAAEATGDAVEAAGDAVEAAGDAVVEKVEEVATGVPTFSDPAVQEYVNAYESYFQEYKKAAESKDMTAFATLGKKGSELGAKAQEIAGKLTPESTQKLTEYMTSKSEEMQKLTALFTAQ